MAGSSSELLGIYFVNGILSAEVIRHGKSVRSWRNLFPVIEEEQLNELLPTIPDQVAFKGYRVSMIIAAPSIEYHLLPVPVMKKHELRQFLKWKAETLKGTAHHWAYTPMKSVRHKKGSVCLHVVPSVYRTIFLDFCKTKHYEPQHLLPLAAVIPDLLEKSDDAEHSVEMVALATDRVTYFVAGNKNAPIFIREIPFTWGLEDQNVYLQFGREIKRTILFAEKQFNQKVSAVRIRGPEVSKAGDAFREIEKIKPEIDPTDVNLFESVFATSYYRTDNFLPFDMLGSRSRVIRSMIIAVLLVLFFGGLISVTFVSSFFTRHTKELIAESNIENETGMLRDSVNVLRNRYAGIEANRVTARYVKNVTGKPVPGWLTVYIADVLPEELILSRLYIERSNAAKRWFVDIEGTGPTDPVHAADILRQFEAELKTGAARLSVRQSWKVQWLNNLRNGGGDADDAFTRRFRITGTVQ
jgi:hypothetical protein